MKKLAVLFSFLFVSGWSIAEPLKTVFNPFTGKLDYITRIDSNTIQGGANCTSTSNSNGTVSITCAGGGGGATNGTVTASQNGNVAIYTLPGSTTTVGGTSNLQVFTSSIVASAPIFISTQTVSSSTVTSQTIATSFIDNGTNQFATPLIINQPNTGVVTSEIDFDQQGVQAGGLIKQNWFSGTGFNRPVITQNTLNDGSFTHFTTTYVDPDNGFIVIGSTNSKEVLSIGQTIGGSYNLTVSSNGLTTVSTIAGAGLSSCSGASNAVSWNSGTNLFGCNTISGTGGSGGYNLQPATVTINANFGITVTTITVSSNTVLAGTTFYGNGQIQMDGNYASFPYGVPSMIVGPQTSAFASGDQQFTNDSLYRFGATNLPANENVMARFNNSGGANPYMVALSAISYSTYTGITQQYVQGLEGEAFIDGVGGTGSNLFSSGIGGRSHTLNGSTTTVSVALYAFSPERDSKSRITDAVGVYVEPITQGDTTNNFSIVTNGGKEFFLDDLYLSTNTPTSNGKFTSPNLILGGSAFNGTTHNTSWVINSSPTANSGLAYLNFAYNDSTGNLGVPTVQASLTSTGSLKVSELLSTYDISAGSMTGAGLVNCPGTNQAVVWFSTSSLFGCANVGSVTNVTGTPPINSSGGATPAISLAQTIGQNETFTSSITMTAALNMSSTSVHFVLDPTAAQDAATKNYVDQAVINAVAYKEAARLATATALPANVYNNGSSGIGATLTGISLAALSVDGAVTIAGDRVLIKNEVTSSNNGIYTVTIVGSVGAAYVLTRAVDFNQSIDIDAGDAIFITSGTANTNTGWVFITTGTITVGSSPMNFVQFSGPGSQTTTLTGDVTGTGTTSIPTTAAITQTNIRTFSGPITYISSVTFVATELNNANIAMSQGVYYGTNTVSSSYLITSTDTIVFSSTTFVGNPSGSVFVDTLPVAAAACINGSGQDVTIYKVDGTSASITIATSGSDLIGGSTGQWVLNSIGQKCELVSDCQSNWFTKNCEATLPSIMNTSGMINSAACVLNAAGDIMVRSIYVPVPTSIVNVRYAMGATITGTVDFGIYDMNSKRLTNNGGKTNPLANTVNTSTMTYVNLSPGWYKAAFTASANTMTFLGNATGLPVGYAKYSGGTGGVLPATLGAPQPTPTSAKGDCQFMIQNVGGGVGVGI